MIKLFELAGADEDRRFSPFVWRIRMALHHKGLDYKGVPWRFTEKDVLAKYDASKVPVIQDGDKTVSDSWDIACYLDETYPDRPGLFNGSDGRGYARFINNWSDRVLLAAMFPMVVADIHRHLADKDKDYFKETREKRMGATLEQVLANRDTLRPEFDKALSPLKATLSSQPFICGDAPAYGDYIVFGGFQWVRSISEYKFLEAGNPVYEWRARMLELFDGAGMKTAAYAP